MSRPLIRAAVPYLMRYYSPRTVALVTGESGRRTAENCLYVAQEHLDAPGTLPPGAIRGAQRACAAIGADLLAQTKTPDAPHARLSAMLLVWIAILRHLRAWRRVGADEPRNRASHRETYLLMLSMASTLEEIDRACEVTAAACTRNEPQSTARCTP